MIHEDGAVVEEPLGLLARNADTLAEKFQQP
jgi:hypothetical protein